ncbi:unnamed protein product [Amaranthus hypochondriacus]
MAISRTIIALTLIVALVGSAIAQGPVGAPSPSPTQSVSPAPTTPTPTPSPTQVPTLAPTPVQVPTLAPSPVEVPTLAPTMGPSIAPAPELVIEGPTPAPSPDFGVDADNMTGSAFLQGTNLALLVFLGIVAVIFA